LKADLTLFQQRTVFCLSSVFGPLQIQDVPPERPYVLSLTQDCYLFSEILLLLFETLRLYSICLVEKKTEMAGLVQQDYFWA
jgi:hypothetical protein